MKKLNILLVFIPISIFCYLVGVDNPVANFTASALSIVPLAGLLGESTEAVSVYVGQKIGGFMNATLGNLTELIISFLALKEGLFDVVKASVAGSVLGNTLLVLGMSMLAGGMKYKFQTFSKKGVNVSLSLLTFAIITLIVPVALTDSASLADSNPINAEGLSVSVCCVMLIIYVASLYFSFFTHREIYVVAQAEDEEIKWSKKKCVLVLVTSILLLAFESELLVCSIEPLTEQLHLSKIFIGLIIIPIIGNAAEHATSIVVAMKNKMDIAIEIAIGSSLQILLFVAPILVLVSWLYTPMALIFNLYEVVGLVIAVLIVNKVCYDGESNWLEGLQLMSVYSILAIAFYLA